MDKRIFVYILCGGVIMHTQPFMIISRSFASGERIPVQYTCDGSNTSPQLSWKDAPAKTTTFALICDDPDAPGKTFVHWVIYNIPATKLYLDAHMPKGNQFPDGTMQGKNDFNNVGYDGPCPPAGTAHHYHFKLYALDTVIALPHGITKQQLLEAMQEHVLAETELIGTYQRKKK